MTVGAGAIRPDPHAIDRSRSGRCLADSRHSLVSGFFAAAISSARR
jgi:hypothetical protein